MVAEKNGSASVYFFKGKSSCLNLPSDAVAAAAHESRFSSKLF